MPAERKTKMTEFLTTNWFWLAPMLLTIGGVIVKATPTKVDDIWWQKAKKVWKTIVKKPA